MVKGCEEILGFIKSHESSAKRVVVIFYFIGVLGLLLPPTFTLFVGLIPLSLLLSFVLLAFFHQAKIDLSLILLFSAIFLLGFFVEAFGVNSGLVFGHYRYGLALGWKFLNTPWIIGLNWLFLTYVTSSILEHFRLSVSMKMLVASLLMVAYDMVLEQVAPLLGMWFWREGIVPIQNYIAWFFIALIFQGLLRLFKVQTDNRLALVLFGSQFLFFVLLFLLLN